MFVSQKSLRYSFQDSVPVCTRVILTAVVVVVAIFTMAIRATLSLLATINYEDQLPAPSSDRVTVLRNEGARSLSALNALSPWQMFTKGTSLQERAYTLEKAGVLVIKTQDDTDGNDSPSEGNNPLQENFLTKEGISFPRAVHNQSDK